MFERGVYPASVTPMSPDGLCLDTESLARLMARFREAGCGGAVLAGTNGEGPSLSQAEKLELLTAGVACTDLPFVMGVATSSCAEAAGLCRSAAELGAVAALVMPPSYFRDVGEDGLIAWFRYVLDRSSIPILVYNFPQRTGIALTGSLLGRLADHPNCAGAKDSSGEPENLVAYRAAMPGKVLYVGDETLLMAALEAGWSGTISGAANLYAAALVEIVTKFNNGDREGASGAFDALLPRLQELRSRPQPATNKARLRATGVLASAAVRPPLTQAEA